MENDGPKQLKLGVKTEEGFADKKKKKEKEEKANKWVLLFILSVTVAASLVFYLWPRMRKQDSGVGGQETGKSKTNWSIWGKPKVIEF